jgi:ribosomal protein S18 acetylase RimI-like enzyme
MNVAAFRIRIVTAEDTDAVITLWQSVFPEYFDAQHPQRDPRANVGRKLAQADDLFWLAESNDEPLRVTATAMAGWDGHRGWLYTVGVHPDARGQGLGRAMVGHAEQALTERGCPKVNLQTMTDSAAIFWRAMGYAPDPGQSFGKRL